MTYRFIKNLLGLLILNIEVHIPFNEILILFTFLIIIKPHIDLKLAENLFKAA